MSDGEVNGVNAVVAMEVCAFGAAVRVVAREIRRGWAKESLPWGTAARQLACSRARHANRTSTPVVTRCVGSMDLM